MITLLSAPTNLGLRPPEPGSVPGAAKAPEALREAGLYERFLARGATDSGVVLPGRYVADDAVRPPGRVRNEAAFVDHSRRLASRIGAALDAGRSPVVVGGDCSVLVAAGIAVRRRGDVGLVHVDGHTDFRHPGNSEACAAVAGEALAAAVGLHWPAISDIDGLGPYFAAEHTAHIGHRDDDEEQEEVRALLARVTPSAEVSARGPRAVAAETAAAAGSAYWLQLDVDVLDPSVMPAVDSPDPGGLTADELTVLLRELAPRAVGASVTVFDPDLDPDGRYARLLTEILGEGLADLGSAVRPA
ncbi:arginase family protein [Microbacterium paraoxydans]|uniref:Arginase family protein n=1 Tax=Microbacterium paraoxydans TaxID=199592 RepID=A0ABS5ILK9_9MICO|nr:arginase family protein [Microbacterium paraoxydans]MBS0023097.1 arginase family protein [Microbacterium paraoxydans]